MARMSKADSEERFWAKVSPEPNTGCWLWNGAANPRGYGVFQLLGRPVTAPRLAWEYANRRDIPHGLFILHSCDVPSCVNPAHLHLGTGQDNIRERDERGRTCRGERHPWRIHPEMCVSLPGERNPAAKLTAEQVREIRRLAHKALRNFPAVARRFGVSSSLVGAIVNRKLWKHLED